MSPGIFSWQIGAFRTAKSELFDLHCWDVLTDHCVQDPVAYKVLCAPKAFINKQVDYL